MYSKAIDDGNKYVLTTGTIWLSSDSYDTSSDMYKAMELTLGQASEAMLILNQAAKITGDDEYECVLKLTVKTIKP